MRKIPDQTSPLLKKQLLQMWYQLVVDIKSKPEAEKILGQVLETSETENIIKRIGVAYWLTKKRSYGNIKANWKVSSATIASVAADLKKPGWQEAMKKILAEEWATKWEAKIKRLFNFQISNSPTPPRLRRAGK